MYWQLKGLTSFVLVLALAAAVSTANTLQQDNSPDGIVSIEAEHYDNNTAQGNSRWQEVGPTDGFTGTKGMQALPNSGASNDTGYASGSPRLDFEVDFIKTGTHYIWIRAWGAGGNDDSCHAGLDGREIDTCDRMSGWSGIYTWSNGTMDDPPSTFEVTSTGLHILNIWMREDGIIIDKIVLTTNPDYVPTGDGPPESERGPRAKATQAFPADGSSDVPQDVVLSWTPGVFGYEHDLYFGKNFDDVNQATTTVDPNGVYMGRFDSNFYPESGTLNLDLDRTYYWRIDEVNAPPSSVIYKGNVWSFTSEAFVYTLSGDNIITTASSWEAGKEPENTVNNSGLDVNDLHTNDTSTMWLTAMGESGPDWIQYEFDKIYKIHQMLVWNYNGQSFLVSYGIKDVIVEYSIDAADWTPINSVSEFAQATGTNDYAHNTIVDFNDVAVKYVKITANSNWSGGFLTQYGLSEVRFMYIPVSAREPNPANEATNVAIDATLDWRTGREADEHNVYFSADRQAVLSDTAPVVTVTEASYGPLSLILDSYYYWRVDEVNNAETPTTWQSNIWSFKTQEYLVVENFESYNDIALGQEGSNLVYRTWIDGYDNPTVNGSTMGYSTGSSIEIDIVHSGVQSVPIIYDNRTASFSEVTVSPADLAIGRNWTIGNPKRLVLWFYGDPNNDTTEQMYIKINGIKLLYDGNADDIAIAVWRPWSIDLALFNVSLNNITTFSIGFDRTEASGGTGIVLLDDIRLHPQLPVIPEPEPFDGRWTYIYNADVASGGADFTALDGTWSHNSASDEWDESRIGDGRPGGASVIDGYLRIQDTGDPSDHGMADPGSNRKVAFAHSITNDIGDSAEQILNGVTISFRARVSTGAPLDNVHPDGGGNITPWPAGGDGYVIHDGGKGNFSIRQSEGDMIISFALALASDDDELPGGGLVMNKLNGAVPTNAVDITGDEPGLLNILELDPTMWHDYWITIQRDITGYGTHLVKIYLDGSLVPNDFYVTAGDGNDYEDSYVLIGLGATPQSGAIDIDYFAYKQGIFSPSP
jgi:hypothetical protein